MTSQELQARLKAFAIRAIHLFKNLPKTDESQIIGKQFLRSALSAAANYRAACKAQTKKSFTSKLSIAYEEGDESVFWLEVMEEIQLLPADRLLNILDEARQLASILAASRKTALSR